MSDIDELYQNQVLELRRGSIVLAIVATLRKQPHYGYSLLESLKEYGLVVEGNTLYPLLRRLQSQGILASEWDTKEARPRKYYSLTRDGAKLYRKLATEWSDMSGRINEIIKEDL